MRHPTDLPAPLERSRSEVVLAELDRLTRSPLFGGSERQTRLLKFLVDEVLAGRGDRLSAKVLASRVFGRAEDFSTTDDSIVRVEVSKLRRALARHYEAADPGEIRIDLPRGSYAPLITFGAEAIRQSQPPRSAVRVRQTGMEPVAAAKVDGPFVAVLPLNAVSISAASLRLSGQTPSGPSSARSMVLAQSVTDRLEAHCATSPYARVLSPASTIEDAALHGARYVLTGSVRLVHGAIRVSVKLNDLVHRVQVWGNTYDHFGEDDKLFSLEDAIAREIMTQILGLPLGAIHLIEAAERAELPIRTPYDMTLRFPRWFTRFDPVLQAEIREASGRLLEEHPDDGVLLAYSSLFHALAAWTAGGEERDRPTATEYARRAIVAEPHRASSHQALGFALVHEGDAAGARTAAETALALGGPLVLTGVVLSLAGEWDRGAEVINGHLAHMKRHYGSVRHALSLGAFRRGDYAAALTEALTIATPNMAFDPLDRAAALARLGRLPEAQKAAAELLAILPEGARDPFDLAKLVSCDEALVADFADALRLAGVHARHPRRRQ